jgi:hypothetical protein
MQYVDDEPDLSHPSQQRPQRQEYPYAVEEYDHHGLIVPSFVGSLLLFEESCQQAEKTNNAALEAPKNAGSAFDEH